MARRGSDRPPYWEAQRLVATARASWHVFDGWAASTGTDPLALPPDRFVNLIYWWLVQNADEKRRREIDSALTAIPAGISDETIGSRPEWSDEAEMAGFAQAAAALGAIG